MWVPGAVRYYFIILQKQEYILQWNWSFFGAIYTSGVFMASGRPCLPGQPWVSGWRSTDCPVPSPRSWMIGSCWLRPFGTGHGFQNSFSSRQHLPGSFLWERTSSLRGSAPYGTRVQICGTSMYGSWMGRGRLEQSTTDSGGDHHSG